ncbi:MAG: hypothetical protein LUG27_02760 [Clostridiales bacterium]|nr:hypothetical protein [Clostridiales bacterium]
MTKTVDWKRTFAASRVGVSRYQYLRLNIPSELQLPNVYTSGGIWIRAGIGFIIRIRDVQSRG